MSDLQYLRQLDIERLSEEACFLLLTSFDTEGIAADKRTGCKLNDRFLDQYKLMLYLIDLPMLLKSDKLVLSCDP